MAMSDNEAGITYLDAETAINLLDNPPEPNEKLQELLGIELENAFNVVFDRYEEAFRKLSER